MKMRLLSWSLMWIGIALALTGLTTYRAYDLDLAVWQRQLQTASGVFYMAAMIIGGVFTTKRSYRQKKPVDKERSFICIMVTLGLFTISLMIS
jgi:hypothetical protein